MNSTWPIVRLGTVVSQVQRPIVPQVGTRLRQIGVRLWGEGAYERETIDGSETKYATLWIAREGDIVVNKIWARNGSVAVVNHELDGCVGSNEFPMYEVKRDLMVPRWFHWLTKTKDFWAQCAEKSRGTSGQNRIRPEHFLDITLPLPPLDEQRRLVERIDTLSAKIREAQQLHEQADVERNALEPSFINSLFTVQFSGDWEQRPLGELAEIQSGVTLGRTLTGHTVRKPYLRVANVQDGYFDLSVIKEIEIRPDEFLKWKLISGDVLLTEGGDWDKLGRGAVWKGEIPDCIHQNHIFRLRVDPSVFDPEYLAILAASPYGKEYFQGASKQTTNLASINQRQLKAFPVMLPSLARQHHIVSQVKGVRDKVTCVRTQQKDIGNELNAMLPAILDRAFRGEL